MQCPSHIASLIDECQKRSGCILLITYRGDGNFLANIFDGEGAEIEYHVPETPSWEPIYQGI